MTVRRLLIVAIIENQSIEVVWDIYSKQHYESINDENGSQKYSFTKMNDAFVVDVYELSKGSNKEIRVRCDYCGKNHFRRYTEYNRSINTNKLVKKYCCENCDQHKKQEVYEIKQSLGLLKRSEKGYWNFKENRLKELKKYIKENGDIVSIKNTKIGRSIYHGLKENGETIEQCSVELDYDLFEINDRKMPEGYYHDFSNLSYRIKELIEQLDRFPKQKEVLNYLRIGNQTLLYFGGISEIKSIMGYDDKYDLIDDRGFKNYSTYEFMTAQYLIGNNISYKREQNPFNGKYKNLRSDFTFYLKNDKEIHVEIWGYSKTDHVSKRSVRYNIDRKLKKKLYSQSDHHLVEIEYEIFQDKYIDIQSNLSAIFSSLFKLDFKFVKQEKFIPTSELTDSELFTEVMKYSYKDNRLPEQKILSENGKWKLVSEVLKRYDSYNQFAEEFNKTTVRSRGKKWADIDVFNKFDYMVSKYGYVLKSTKIKAIKNSHINNIEYFSRKVFGGFFEAKLSYFEYLTRENKQISNLDIQYIIDASKMSRGFNRKYLTDERLSRFKNILDTIRESNNGVA